MWALLVLVASRRQGTLAEHAPWNAKEDRTWVTIGGIVVPTLILAVMFGASLVTMFAVPTGGTAHDSMNGMADGDAPAIQVIGHQWWWEVRYPGSGAGQEIVTANEIHLPVGQPTNIQLMSRDVIHSFWVPQLHGKVDLVPGVDNRIQVQADAAGLYRGACAEFCGRQHAHMLLLVSVDDPAAFDAWKRQQRTPAVAPAGVEEQQGEALFMKHDCALCHTIRGTRASALVGPDLTHIGSRRAIASNTFWNNTGNMEAWVTHAQSLKPGSAMPDITGFTDDELHALVAYLQALR
jgi:cytochrome c oxidase subunit 2